MGQGGTRRSNGSYDFSAPSKSKFVIGSKKVHQSPNSDGDELASSTGYDDSSMSLLSRKASNIVDEYNTANYMRQAAKSIRPGTQGLSMS